MASIMECITSFEARMRKEYTLYNLHGFSRENNPDFLYYFDLLHYWWFNFSEAVRGKGKMPHWVWLWWQYHSIIISFTTKKAMALTAEKHFSRRSRVQLVLFPNLIKRLQDTSPYHTPIRFPVVITSLSTGQCIVLKFEFKKLQPVQITPSCYK